MVVWSNLKKVNMNILLTGGTGFIGSHLLHKLLKSNYSVVILKRRTSDIWRIKDCIDRIHYIDTDKISDTSIIFTQHKIDMIIHLAGVYIKHHSSAEEIEEMNSVNITFPAKLVENAVKYGVKNIINTGSFFEYDRTGVNISEKSRINPYNYYAVTKIAFEEIIKFYSEKYNIRALTLKLFSPYGEKDNKKIIPLIIESLFQQTYLSMNDEDQHLSFTYIDDIVDAYLRAISFLQSDTYTRYEVFNIGNPHSYSVKQIVEYLTAISNNQNNAIKMNKHHLYRDNKHDVCCECTKAEKMLGWKAKVDIKKGLVNTYNYYKNQCQLQYD